MDAPIVFIFSATIQEGKLDAYRAYTQEHVEFARTTHPDVLAFHLYVDEDGSEVAAVQVHPDAASVQRWMTEVVAEHGVKAYEFLERGSERAEVYGTLSEDVLEQLRQFGVPLTARPSHIGGFTRLAAHA